MESSLLPCVQSITGIPKDENTNLIVLEVERAIENLRNKSSGADHIPPELIQSRGGRLYEEIHKLIVLI